jgi:hypothetical protein
MSVASKRLNRLAAVPMETITMGAPVRASAVRPIGARQTLLALSIKDYPLQPHSVRSHQHV